MFLNHAWSPWSYMRKTMFAMHVARQIDDREIDRHWQRALNATTVFNWDGAVRTLLEPAAAQPSLG
jgi:hypothetical protein